jgi:hypothetical protein
MKTCPRGPVPVFTERFTAMMCLLFVVIFAAVAVGQVAVRVWEIHMMKEAAKEMRR